MGLHPNAKYHRRTSSMRYVTTAELSDLIRKNLWKIPHDIDLVVGVPRSGMLPATMISLFLNTRLTDIDSFVEHGSYFTNGISRGTYVKSSEIKKILIVDDSIDTGKSLLAAQKKLGKIRDKKFEDLFCVPIASTSGANMVDLHFTIIDDDRLFEWNIFHHAILENTCVDIDGVLCMDPVEDDDGEKYQYFLNTANPLFTPTCRINTLISCRLEKYRTQTENWLKKHNIVFDNLIMLDLPNKTERLKWNNYGNYKGTYYKEKEDCILFIESSFFQAKQIAEISHKPVYCVETNTMIHMLNPTSKRKRVLRALRKRTTKCYHCFRALYYSIIK